MPAACYLLRPASTNDPHATANEKQEYRIAGGRITKSLLQVSADGGRNNPIETGPRAIEHREACGSISSATKLHCRHGASVHQ